MAEATQVVDTVEAFDAVRDSFHLEDCQVVWHWGHSVDLQVWGGRLNSKINRSHIGPKVKVGNDSFDKPHSLTSFTLFILIYYTVVMKNLYFYE